MKNSIVVAAYRSEMGKTTFVCRFLTHYPLWAAVKMVTYHKHKLPVEIGVRGFDIVTDPELLSKANTDTGRIWEIVKNRTFWVRSKPEFLQQAVRALLRKINKFDSVIIESTSILHYFQPSIAIMLVDDKEIKPSARQALDDVDIFLPAINYDFNHKINLPDKYMSKYKPIDWNNSDIFTSLVNTFNRNFKM